MDLSRRDTRRILPCLISNESSRTSSCLVIGLIAVIALLNPVYLGSSSSHTPTTIVLTAGSSGPRIAASVVLTSSTYNNWYAQNRTPAYPNNTKTISVVNIEGSYANGSSRRSLLLQAQQVTNASGGNSTTLFQQEFPGYAAGDGVFHRYSIEVDLLSNRTIWIVDDTIIAMFKLSFVPANMVLIASATDPRNLAVATLEDPVQTALLPLVPVTSTPFTGT